MKEKYYDRINKTEIEVNVNAKVAHFLQKEREKNRILSPDEIAKLSKKKQEEYYQRSFERKQESLEQIMFDGFQPSDDNSIEDELYKRHQEKKYLASKEYKEFRIQLKREIRKVLDKMSDQQKKVMYLRFFKDYSLRQIATALNLGFPTVRNHIIRGLEHIKYFLDADIKEQDKKDKEKRMRIAQIRQQKYKH